MKWSRTPSRGCRHSLTNLAQPLWHLKQTHRPTASTARVQRLPLHSQQTWTPMLPMHCQPSARNSAHAAAVSVLGPRHSEESQAHTSQRCLFPSLSVCISVCISLSLYACLSVSDVTFASPLFSPCQCICLLFACLCMCADRSFYVFL